MRLVNSNLCNYYLDSRRRLLKWLDVFSLHTEERFNNGFSSLFPSQVLFRGIHLITTISNPREHPGPPLNELLVGTPGEPLTFLPTAPLNDGKFVAKKLHSEVSIDGQ